MTLTLLQRGFQPGANPGVAGDLREALEAAAVVIRLFILAVYLAALVTHIVVLVQAMQTLREVRKRNRPMEPGLVWLALIPLFRLGWLFWVVTKTADGLHAEFDDRQLRRKRDSGEAFGMTYATLLAINSAVGILMACTFLVSCLNIPMVLVQLLFGVTYARKLYAAKQRLRRDSNDQGDEDFEDDEPRPKPKKKPKLDDDFEEYDEPKGGR